MYDVVQPPRRRGVVVVSQLRYPLNACSAPGNTESFPVYCGAFGCPCTCSPLCPQARDSFGTRLGGPLPATGVVCYCLFFTEWYLHRHRVLQQVREGDAFAKTRLWCVCEVCEQWCVVGHSVV
jgi:hypothetical protein